MLRFVDHQADALTIKFRQILKKIVEAKTRMGTTLKASAFALTEAKYAAGEQVNDSSFFFFALICCDCHTRP